MWRDTYILLKFSMQIVDLVKCVKLANKEYFFFSLKLKSPLRKMLLVIAIVF